MSGYVRQSEEGIQPLKRVASSLFNNEFDALANAFKGDSGHVHDGTEGNGPKLDINLSTEGILSSDRVDIPVVEVPVTSVNSKTGDVVLGASDVGAISSSKEADLDANTAARHSHSNKNVLDATTASFLVADKTKLSGVEAGAQVNTVASVNTKVGDIVLNASDVGAISSSKEADLDANTSARHSHSNKAILDGTQQSFTTTLKNKLDGVEEGAQVNTITSVNSKTGDITLSASDVEAIPYTHSSTNTGLLGITQDEIAVFQAAGSPPSVSSTIGAQGSLSLVQLNSVKTGPSRGVGAILSVDADSSDNGLSLTVSKIGGASSNFYFLSTGQVLAQDPLEDGHLATKRYVDSKEVVLPSNLVNTVNSRTGDVVLSASDVGLESVDNTSDADKPISALTQNALDDKLDKTAKAADSALLDGKTPAQLPISTLTQNVLNAKAPLNNPTFTGTVNVATLVASSDISLTSDIRKKTGVQTVDYALDMVNHMRGVYYEMGGKVGVGVIAQEMEKVLPEVVNTLDDEDKTKTVSYGNIVGVLIEAIKELSKEVDELRSKVDGTS